VVFTESRRTQDYLRVLLEANGYAGEVVCINGSNSDAASQQLYRNWKQRHPTRVSGAKTADVKAAIVEHFRDSMTILLATESAAEGVNLQFCSLVVNYDLPWNPQRVE
jgi:superfamily II DNA/RNA helicase